MARRKRTKDEALPAANWPSAVRAIFDPAGDIHVRAVAPSGNAYEIAPRVAFPIASEDVDWFFCEWNWEHRQCLSREEEYQPRRPQFNNGRQIEDRPDRPQFDNGAASRTARAEELERPSFDNGGAQPTYHEPASETSLLEPLVEPEPVLELEPPVEPDSVVKVDAGETDEDKE